MANLARPADWPRCDAVTLAEQVKSGAASATRIVSATLERIEALDDRYVCFTTVTRARALARAASIDQARAQGACLPVLAGVPYAVKNLFDLEGVVTLAGAKINRDHAPATTDATLVTRLERAGAICVGALNMDEYAYGFTTENAHDGTTRNPHDVERVAGGSSGGSAAAVAAGLVPLSLGSDTNGSIRVPASLCGIFGLKPTYGRLPRTGSAMFVASLDHLGPFARSVRDLALAYDAMQGPDAADPACAQRGVEPVSAVLERGVEGIRIAMANGYFTRNAGVDAQVVLARAAAVLNVGRTVDLPELERARAAAFLITASEGSQLHLPDLKRRAGDFDPATRDRFLAGAMVPAAWYVKAQRFRAWFREAMLRVFAEVDVILAPATPIPAPLAGQATFELGGRTLPTRPSLGLLTQPISFIGLPVVAVPIRREGALPLGVQVIAAPWREDLAMRVARVLESSGVARAPIAEGALAELPA